MRELGLQGVMPRKFRVTTDSDHEHPIAKNVLDRDFEAQRPNQKWVTDITYIRTQQGWAYLSVIKDLFDSFIVAYQFELHPSVGLVTRTLKQARKKEKLLMTLGMLPYLETPDEFVKVVKEFDVTSQMLERLTTAETSPYKWLGLAK